MLDSEQIKNITYVYDKLMNSESIGWAEIDDALELVEYLDDDQLYRECDVLYVYQQSKTIVSVYEDTRATNFVKNILDASEAILNLYDETGNMHPKNRYILSYYLALCQVGQIVELVKS